jgi:tetraacyldisaccharide 4'-kinase
VLPAGPLREPARRIGEVDMVVLNGPRTPALGLPADRLVRMVLERDRCVRWPATRRCGWTSSGAGRSMPSPASATRSDSSAMLRANGIETRNTRSPIITRSNRGTATGDDHVILMTEKDAVKCGSPTGACGMCQDGAFARSGCGAAAGRGARPHDWKEGISA